jgi:RNA polymerase sigma factor (sigma-70 family)
MTHDAELLRRYAADSSEAAFTELVQRHVNLVYSAALRLVNGDTHRAQDVTQQVFTELARQAKRLTRHSALLGWLYTTTRLMALRSIRTDQRRHAREQEANVMNEIFREPAAQPDWEHLRPVLEDAMHELGEKDRLAVLLRYFQNKNLADVGAALGLNENAARMRVNRALEKLREQLARKGVTSTASALSLALAANAVTAAPPAFVATLASASLVTATAATASTFTILNFMAMSKLQMGIVTAMVAAGLVTPLVIQHRAQTKLREENQSLWQQVERLSQLQAANEALSNHAERAGNRQSLSDDQLSELLRLRGEMTGLRRDSQELAKLKAGAGAKDNSLDDETKVVQAKIAQLKQALDESPDKKIPELQFLTPHDWFNVAMNADLKNAGGVRYNLNSLRSAAKDRFAPMMARALRAYLQANDGQLPTDISQLKPFFDAPMDDALLQRYELLHAGNVKDFPPEEMVVGEKSAVDPVTDSLFSIGVDRYQIKPVWGEVNGRGMRGNSIQMWKYFEGVPIRSR